jgi:hypothetical protein
MIFWLCSSGSLVSYKPLGDTHIGTKTTFTPETWPFNIFIHCFASTTAQTFFFQINLRAKSTYQQSPNTPCMISDGLGLRKTSHGSCDWDVICWGLNHRATRGCVDDRGVKYRELGSGGNESSTNDMLCYRMKKQGQTYISAILLLSIHVYKGQN